ncbi:MAG: hypothetical protein DMF68_20645 [Acidobacteria bacterium]|nr:MAG: hypothetical protein DMF68_20645 [Acidobacteriota bacterium]
MSEVLRQPLLASATATERRGLRSFLPAIVAVGGSILLVLLRLQLGGAHFISDEGLMLLALACYLTAAVFHLTNLYAPSEMAQKAGLWLATTGVFFNLSSWGVRWINARDMELAAVLKNGGEMPWFARWPTFRRS